MSELNKSEIEVTNREIPEQLNMLSNMVERLDKAVESIGSRVEPVLSQVEPSEKLIDEKTKEITSTFGIRIKEMRYKIESNIRILSDLSERIEL